MAASPSNVSDALLGLKLSICLILII